MSYTASRTPFITILEISQSLLIIQLPHPKGGVLRPGCTSSTALAGSSRPDSPILSVLLYLCGVLKVRQQHVKGLTAGAPPCQSLCRIDDRSGQPYKETMYRPPEVRGHPSVPFLSSQYLVYRLGNRQAVTLPLLNM